MEKRRNNMAQQVTAIILAAGSGSRFNAPNKQYKLSFPLRKNNRENTVLMHTLESIDPAVAHRICIIDPRKKDQLGFIDNQDSLQIIENPQAELGMAESIKIGVSLVPPAHGVMICLADMPYIQTSTYQSLVEHFLEHDGKIIVRPTFQGRDGHPVIFPYTYCPQLLTLNGDQGAKSIINEGDLKRVEVDDKGVIQDIDHYSDIAPL